MIRGFLSLRCVSAAFVLGCLAGCTAAGAGASGEETGAIEESSGSGSGNGSSTGSAGEGGGLGLTSGNATGTTGTGNPATCPSGPDDDTDGDGVTPGQGDCNDCDANVGPGAIEVIGADGMAPADEDCDGTVDNVAADCDTGIPISVSDAYAGARAVDLCQQATVADKKWGVLSAAFVRSNGTPANVGPAAGVLPGFGGQVQPQHGAALLALSSGVARVPGDPEACPSQSCATLGSSPPAPNFPQAVPNCPGATAVNDDVGLELKLRAPTNATGYKFKFKFYSFEFAEWVCTDFNDQFIALVNPPPQGAINGNISFDSLNNPVSVNIAFFDVCNASTQSTFAQNCNLLGTGTCPTPPSPYCPSGAGDLAGTGFDTLGDAGATSWLETAAPVTGGQEFTIRFAIWDTGDQSYDSTVLVDAFEWVANGGTVAVGTDPVEDPK